MIERVLLTLVFIGAMGFLAEQAKSITASAGTLETTSLAHASSFSDYSNIYITAEAALSTRVGRGETLFALNEQKKLPIASLTKLMTALIVLERYDLTHPIATSEFATLPVRDLLYITLMESSNHAAYALSELMGAKEFVDSMNAKAAQLGMKDTHFNDSTGLSSESYSTAHDVALLSTHLVQNYPLFTKIVGLKEFDLYVNGKLRRRLVNTNRLLGEYGIVGGKTGWTNEAKGCLMVFEKKGEEYIVHVVLGAEDRFEEMKKLIHI